MNSNTDATARPVPYKKSKIITDRIIELNVRDTSSDGTNTVSNNAYEPTSELGIDTNLF